MRQAAMQKRVSPRRENALDNAGNRQRTVRWTGAHNDKPDIEKNMTMRALRPSSQEERPCVFITIATPT